MPADDPDLLLGQLAVHYKLLTKDQVAAAWRRKEGSGAPVDFASFLVAEGYLAAPMVRKLLKARQAYLERQQGAKGDHGAAPAAATAAAGESGPLGYAPGIALEDLLARAAAAGASDLHVHSGAPLQLRLHGRLEVASAAAIGGQEAARLVDGLLTGTQRAELAAARQLDFAYAIPEVGRFRANLYHQQRGVDGVFRVIPPRPPTLEELGLPASLAQLTSYHQGIVLLTGPAGCGKSTTLAALVDLINRERQDHVVTIEDPIEHLHRSRRCVVNQRQVGRHTASFARALRAALREDPDVIVIGELRDLETVSLALTAAETGHLVLGTLHTSSAIRTVNRLLGVFPPQQQAQIRTMVSESLRGIVSQRLVARADGTGRAAALELLINTRAVGNLIRENKTYQLQSVMQTGAGQGMALLDASLAELVRAGTISPAEAARHAEDPRRFAPAGEGG